MKKIRFIILSFILPIILFAVFSFFMHKSQFLLKFSDTYVQYVPLFKNFQSVIIGNNSILYSFFKGLGGNMLGTFVYYLSCPLNIFVVFFGDRILLFLNILVLVKIGLCGLCMFIYLCSKNEKAYLINLSFSLCYSLMGFTLLYINNIFWFDVVYITPLVMLGIDKIIKKENAILYIITLIYAIICNFYIAFSLCIFSVIYFFYNLFLNKVVEKKKIIIKFFIYSLLAGLICSIILIPTLYEYFQLNSRQKIYSTINYDYLNIPYIFYKLLIGSNTLISSKYTILYGAPNLYCSVFCVLLNILYFINSDISKKEKLLTIYIYIFFVLTMTLTPLYNFWHGFSNPNGNPYRFSYLWTFFQILIAYKSFFHIPKFSKKFKISLFLSVFSYFLCIILMVISNSYNIIFSGFEVVISLIFMCFYLIALYYNKYIILTMILITELSVNIYLYYSDTEKVYLKDYNYICDEIKNNKKIRLEISNYNAGMYCGFGSLSYYYTSTNENINNFFKRTGLLSDLMYLDSYNYTTDLIYDLFGVDYTNLDGNFKKNDNSLSIGYMINYDNKIISNKNPLNYQKNLLNSMINQNLNYFKKYDLYRKSNDKYYFYNNKKTKYVLINDSSNKLLDITSKDSDHTTFLIANFSVLRINNFKDEKVDIRLKLNCSIKKEDCITPKIQLYELDEKMLNRAINILKSNQLNITKMEKNVLEGDIDVDEKNILFLSIPYEEGWNIYVDGKKVDYFKIYDAFIGIDLTKGHHEIKMKFYPKGLNEGIIISLSTLTTIIIYNIFKFRKGKQIS